MFFYILAIPSLNILDLLVPLYNLAFLETLDNKKSPGAVPGDYYREGIVNYLTITFLPSMM